MVANRDKDLDDHTGKMTETQKEMKKQLEQQHPGVMDSSHGVVGQKADSPPLAPDNVTIRARDKRFYEQAVRAASYFSDVLMDYHLPGDFLNHWFQHLPEAPLLEKTTVSLDRNNLDLKKST